MFYHLFKAPAIIKTGVSLLGNVDALLESAHLFFPQKVLVTQQYLFDLYKDQIGQSVYSKVIFIQGGKIDEAQYLIEEIKNTDAIVIAFGGGSVLDIVKYCASRCDIPYITVPSTLSNDAIYSCVARLTENGKKRSYGVQPPIGIIVDLDIIRRSPTKLILAGVADLVSNLSALADWKLAYKNIGEPINELAYLLAKEAPMPMFNYSKQDLLSDDFLFDLTNGLITSGLSMIISGNTRGTSGAEHLISHAIDEYFPERSSVHGLQVGWAHLYIDKHMRDDSRTYKRIYDFYNRIGLLETIEKEIGWMDSEFPQLIPYARQIRNRYTIFNVI